MKNKKRVLIASSLSCAILLLSAATTQANSAHKDSQDQNKKEHVDKSQQKDKRNVTNKDKNSTVPDDIGKNGKITKRTETVYDEKTNILQNLQFDFIDDPTYDKNVLLVKKQGSIHSNLKFESHKEEKNSNWLKYPVWIHRNLVTTVFIGFGVPNGSLNYILSKILVVFLSSSLNFSSNK